MIEFIDQPTRITAIHKNHVATLSLEIQEGGIVCGDFASTGNPVCILAIFRRLVARGLPVIGIVDESQHSVKEQIASLYERFKFIRTGSMVMLPDGTETTVSDLDPPNRTGRIYRLN